VAGGWRQILANGQHVNVVCTHIAHDFQNFFICLAQADHQAAFGGDFRESALNFLSKFKLNW